MHFTEEQTALLKTWVIKKLEDISDADADVLADYALALVSTEDSEDVARANCIENLKDFLPNNAEQFVGELFDAIASRSYDPNAPKPKPAPPVPQLPTGPRNDSLGPIDVSRKRSFQCDRDEGVGQNGYGHAQGGSRPIKQMRRGGRGGFDHGGRQQPVPLPPFPHQQFSQPPPMANLAAPPNLPPLDPNDMMAMMAWQQFMNGMPGLPNAGSPQNGLPYLPPGSRQRCRDYDTKGFCARGASCPYEHGNDRFVIPAQSQEYDPSNAMLNFAPNGNGNVNGFSDRGHGRNGVRGRGRGTNNFRGGGHRSQFSQLGPNRDRTNTSIVVEQIPDDKLEEESVYGFFSEFGNIAEISMHPDRKLAIVKYEDKQGAKAAYESPRVVFDNRFVKVYWYDKENFEQQRNGHAPVRSAWMQDVAMQDDEEQIDPVELAKRQEEAQRKHEQTRRQREEAEKQKASLDEKLKAMEAERKKMADLLAKKSGKPPTSASASPAPNGNTEESEQTKGLRAQLARLEAEAKARGIDPDAPVSNVYDNYNGYNTYSPPPYRGRGGYRGRSRGRGYHQAHRGGAVMRLDNRPKTLFVTFPTANHDANDEALRQFLLFNNIDPASISKHVEKDDTALVTFRQRYEGENFMGLARGEIPHAGRVEVGWWNGPAPVSVKQDSRGVNGNGGGEKEWDGKVEVEGDAGDREMFDDGEGDGEEQDLDRFA